jgi:hypothetical protein
VTATATPLPFDPIYCKQQVCIRQVSAGVNDRLLVVRFDLFDPNGEVLFAQEPQFSEKLVLALYLERHTGERVYLFGGNIPRNRYSCYVGNDIPGYYGWLAVICTVGIPREITQVRVNPGDRLVVELPEYNNLVATVYVQQILPLAGSPTPYGSDFGVPKEVTPEEASETQTPPAETPVEEGMPTPGGETPSPTPTEEPGEYPTPEGGTPTITPEGETTYPTPEDGTTYPTPEGETTYPTPGG